MQKKLVAVFCCFILLFSLLYLRVGELSLNQNLANVSQKQSSFSLSFNQTRGQIYDCRFIPLVDVERKYIASILPTPQNIVGITKSPAIKTKSNIVDLINKGKPFLATSLLPKTTIPQAEVFSIPKRYEKEQLAQHLIGYIDTSSNTGFTGIEKAFNDLLSSNSQSSKVSYRLDGMGKPLFGAKPTVSLAPIRNDGVVLTIDKRIQKICEDTGKKHLKKGAIIVMEPSTGKLKAVASFPSYSSDKLSIAINDKSNSPLLNRAFSAFTVGSTFKLVTAATALSEGISANTTFYCNGKTNVGDVTFGCHEKNGHGKVDMKTAMVVSCNPYFINLSSMITKQRFINMASDLSFGKQIDFANGLKTASGHLPSIDELFNPAAVANMSFGQGSLTATPVQVAQMVSSIVNEGNTMPAMLVEGTTNDGKIISKKAHENFPVRAMDKNIALALKQYMVEAVMNTKGQNSRPINTTAGGKTGTAQTGQMKNGEEILQGWFAGFFPADKPKYVVVVLSEDARSGNQDASPIFREIVDTLTAPIVLSKEACEKK